MIHELAHALLHSEEVPRPKEVAEVEVESVAFVVCDAIGLDTGDYSFPYVARWAEGSSEIVKETAEGTISCAKGILTALEAASEPTAPRKMKAALCRTPRPHKTARQDGIHPVEES